MTTDMTKEGMSAPLGATLTDGGVNFSVFSKNAALVELLLFDDRNAAQPTRIIPLAPHRNRTYHYWHIFVPDLKPGQIYAYRAQGRLRPNEVSDLMVKSFSSTRMAWLLRFPKATTAKPRADPATTQPPR